MTDPRAKLEALCKEYDLRVSENPRNNIITILEAAEPSQVDKLNAFDYYEEWLRGTYLY